LFKPENLESKIIGKINKKKQELWDRFSFRCVSKKNGRRERIEKILVYIEYGGGSMKILFLVLVLSIKLRINKEIYKSFDF
jgi:hypothetical protein